MSQVVVVPLTLEVADDVDLDTLPAEIAAALRSATRPWPRLVDVRALHPAQDAA